MKEFEALRERLAVLCPQLELRTQEPMSRHTTFRVGGPCALMALPKSENEARAAVTAAHELGISPFFLGNGSNLLVPDQGVERFLIKTTGLDWVERQGNVLSAGGGITLARLARFAQGEGLSGLEFAHGIPGSLGGGVTMNAGAYGGELKDVVRSVTCLNEAGETEEVTDCDFSYRHSAFSDGRRMVLSARLELTPGDPQAILARMEELSAQRQAKQPLEYPSAGSMFKRPQGYFAAALIDQCGLKGFLVGGAQVSEKHAGFVVNRGGATCEDILTLVDRVKTIVRDKTGVELEMEVKILQ